MKLVMTPNEVVDMRAKWERYDARLKEVDGNGSIVGAAFIIAKTGVTDILAILDKMEA